MATKHFIPLTMKEMQIITTLKFLFTPVRIAITKNNGNKSLCSTEYFYTVGRNVNSITLRKTNWRVLKKLEIKLSQLIPTTFGHIPKVMSYYLLIHIHLYPVVKTGNGSS